LIVIEFRFHFFATGPGWTWELRIGLDCESVLPFTLFTLFFVCVYSGIDWHLALASWTVGMQVEAKIKMMDGMALMASDMNMRRCVPVLGW
jgi:hypothetical protein